MHKKACLFSFFLLALLCFACTPLTGAASTWSKTYGDTVESEGASAVIETADGGFVVAGGVNHNTFGVEKNQEDIYLFKTDAAGNQLWNRTFGGNESAIPGMYYMEGVSDLVATADGGFALAGSQSIQPSATGIPSGCDVLLIKTDAEGSQLWNRTYGNPGNDHMESATSILITADGGFLLVGSVYPWPTGNRDIWMVKTDAAGNMQWNKTFGTERMERYATAAATVDGYIFVCTSNSTFYLNDCALLIKTDFNGDMKWNRTFEGPIARSPYKIIATSDGGYAFCGTYGGPGQNVSSWLVKTDSYGNPQFDFNYGYGLMWYANTLAAAPNGGYALGGNVLIKTDAFGNLQWNRSYSQITTNAITVSSDGGFVLAGKAQTPVGRYYNYDFSLIKTDEYGVVPEYSAVLLVTLGLLMLTPIVWNKKGW